MEHCAVCGDVAVEEVTSLLLNNFKLPYCARCIAFGAEPYDLLVSVSVLGIEDNIFIESIDYFEDDYYCGTITETLSILGKTEEQFVEDVNAELRSAIEEDKLMEYISSLPAELHEDDEFFK